MNSKLRRAVRARGHFPNDEAALKLDHPHGILLLDDGKGASPQLSLADEAALVEALTERLFTTMAEVIALAEERFTPDHSVFPSCLVT